MQIKSCYTTTATDLTAESSHMTWMQHPPGKVFACFWCRNNREEIDFCIESFSHNFYRLFFSFFFFFCDGATRVFVRFTSWYALVLHSLGCSSPALLFNVTASHLHMFCGGRVVKSKLASHLDPPCRCSHDFWRCFSGFDSSFGVCFGCRVAKQPLSVNWRS